MQFYLSEVKADLEKALKNKHDSVQNATKTAITETANAVTLGR